MARTDTRFRQSHNAMLDMLSTLPLGAGLPSEVQLAAQLGVSRTVIRAVVQKLGADGILQGSGREKRLTRLPKPKDRLSLREDYIGRDELEARFLDWVLRFDVPAGTALNITQLARQFTVPPHALQEFLASLGQSGLIERRARGGWRLLGFTADYAVELSEFRQVLELNAIRAFTALPKEHAAWTALSKIRAEHLELLDRIDRDFHDFSRLDGRFHSLINSVVSNRFVAEFQKVISLIFHYHYQWDKTMERYRNEAAIREHLTIIAALQDRDTLSAEARARGHLATSKETLLSSMRGHHLA
ncbi:MAG: GntR family transcriptional regulator [Pseudotabrizicola sp.]|uniref:GntR family transcriptional regulator n=1 Tax=Pseudotabrizicola sp. TaxID=2939647 RepID=UPI00271FD9FA|nr:GntR family transcriptional regulator [Pseudotabrizicola sp.]MDO8884711.1 GntR family transcriptional regulator [Pseudotabrizicola sp.]MDP2082561.1 GntR family transcriptional regulator [Pseudotabrizicola sp.]MDZ7573928.1 GntR family transcriptional regulator [Pseudotabrizicola sp.]